jgi:hypothetical protein
MLHRDFVPWRFSNAGRISTRLAHQRRRPLRRYGISHERTNEPKAAPAPPRDFHGMKAMQ